jgi:hypothetical protein
MVDEKQEGKRLYLNNFKQLYKKTFYESIKVLPLSKIGDL